MGDRFVATAERMVHGGHCTVKDPVGATVLVAGAIPGEDIEVEVTSRRAKSWFGKTTAVLTPSPHRIDPPCPYVPRCGGCQLQHIEVSHQLTLKRDIVMDQFHRAHVDVSSVEPHLIASVSPFDYRWRGEFHVIRDAKSGMPPLLGFKPARSWTPFPIDDCLIHHPTIRKSLGPLRKLAAALPEASTLHVTVGGDGDELLISGRPKGSVSMTPLTQMGDVVPAGMRWVSTTTDMEWRGHHYRVSPESFIQVNRATMERLYGVAIEAMGDISGMRIADAYGGMGVLAIELALKARTVVCIETSRSACQMGIVNAQANGVVDKVIFDPHPVEEALPRLSAQEPFDLVMLDPPRAGCDSTVCAWLALQGPQRLIYMSCDPATLARDLSVMTRMGPYRITSVDIVDMFPQTYHVETVVAMERQGDSGRRDAHE